MRDFLLCDPVVSLVEAKVIFYMVNYPDDDIKIWPQMPGEAQI